MAANKVDLIRQALNASESSIKLARQLLGELEQEGRKGGGAAQNKAKELPGKVGMFDGKEMVTEAGERFAVPENYASKSILVVGDTLKLVESGGTKKFKQIEHVKRHKTNGIIAKKDGKWTAVTPEGSYKLLAAAVEHFGADVGDEVLIQLPANNLQTIWAAVEKVTKKVVEKKDQTLSTESSTKKVEEEKPKLEDSEKTTKPVEKKQDTKQAPSKKAESAKTEKPAATKKPEVKEVSGVASNPAATGTKEPAKTKTEQQPPQPTPPQVTSEEPSEDELR